MSFLRGIVVWLVIMLAETLHGTARNLWLAPYMSDLSARQVSFFSGTILILAIATLFAPWLRASRSQLLKIGLLWAMLTAAFELALGRFVLRYSWERILADYNLFQGGLMAFGLVILVFAPLIAARLRHRLVNYQRNA
jgi:hypothetical protein